MIENTVKQFVVDNFLFGDGSILNSDTSFLDEAIIDSTGILELIMYLEETFDVTIEDEELVPENLDSLSNIQNFVQTKQCVHH